MLGSLWAWTEAGWGGSQGYVPPAPVPRVQQHLQWLHTLCGMWFWMQDGPPPRRWEGVKEKSEKRNQGSWKGTGWLLEAPAVFSQMEGLLEQNICSLQARLFLCTLCICSCPLCLFQASWGEDSVSVQCTGNEFRLLLAQGGEDDTYLASPCSTLSKCSQPWLLRWRTLPPASQWPILLLSLSHALNLFPWTCSSFQSKLRELLQQG